MCWMVSEGGEDTKGETASQKALVGASELSIWLFERGSHVAQAGLQLPIPVANDDPGLR